MASISPQETSDGPVLRLINKKLRALKKKHTRILQLEESQALGKTLNKEQEDLLKSKPSISVIIEEYEKLRQPLSTALQEELSRFSPPPTPTQNPRNPKSENFEDLLRLLYFGCLFDVKSQSEFTSTLLTRTHERGCCLTYDYVTDEATDLLGEGDLDMISALSGLLTSRPVYSGVSHKNALEGCIERAKLWLQKSEEPISPGASVTYAGLREKLNKIMSLDYFTMTPEMKAPVDVAAVVGKYNSSVSAQEDLQIDGGHSHYEHKEHEQEEFKAVEASIDQSAPSEETEKVDEATAQILSENTNSNHNDEETAEPETAFEQNQRDYEHKEHQHQYIPRRAYRGGRGGGGRRDGYINSRGGGRRGRGGDGGAYQNGRSQQYYDSGYPRNNYYNSRGRGGGRYNSSSNNNNNNYGGGQVEFVSSS